MLRAGSLAVPKSSVLELFPRWCLTCIQSGHGSTKISLISKKHLIDPGNDECGMIICFHIFLKCTFPKHSPHVNDACCSRWKIMHEPKNTEHRDSMMLFGNRSWFWIFSVYLLPGRGKKALSNCVPASLSVESSLYACAVIPSRVSFTYFPLFTVLRSISKPLQKLLCVESRHQVAAAIRTELSVLMRTRSAAFPVQSVRLRYYLIMHVWTAK